MTGAEGSIPPGTGTEAYPWPGGRRAAAVVSLDFDGPAPYLWAQRDQAPAVVGELEQRRFGPRQGVWRMLAMLERLDLRASFFIPGAVADAHRVAVEAIVAGGHEVGLHGFLHERVDALSRAELDDVLARSQAALEAAGARGPFGYRSPSWEMTDDAWAALRAFGMAYDSSLMGYEHPYWIGDLVEVPVSWALDDAIFYRYTPGTVRPPVAPAELMAGWADELEAAKRFGSTVVFTVHPWLSGWVARAAAFEALLERYRSDPDIWWATVGEIAAHHRTLPGGARTEGLHPGHMT
jgi:peptidoglycan-N-acetylglucosamine deacetylase